MCKTNIDYFFQPIVSFKDKNIFGYEALMRPQGVNVEEYIKLNKNNLYDIEFNTWVLSLKKFKERKLKGKIFLNSFPSLSLTEEDFIILNDIYSSYFLKEIVIEILEYEDLNDNSFLNKVIFKDQHKCLIALDDFGTGNNNISMISKINPDIIKLDRSLISNIDIDLKKQEKLLKLIDKIRNINPNILILSEGIETIGEYNFLKDITDLGQGYYIGKPNQIPSIDLKILKSTIPT